MKYKICKKCECLMVFDPYFTKYICVTCGFMEDMQNE